MAVFISRAITERLRRVQLWGSDHFLYYEHSLSIKNIYNK